MFAYVRFSDGTKHIVPTEDIKKFDPKNYLQDIFYIVRWENADFKAQIILVKEAREEIEEELAHPTKRLRISKILSHDCVDSYDETATLKEKASLTNKTKTLKSVEAAEKKKSLLKILEESKMRRKENPLFENNSNKRKEDFSDSEDSDGGAVVPKKIHEDLDKKYRFQKKQKHQLQEELMDCKKRHAELEKINKDLVAELTTYRQLNVTLQQNINEVLQRAFSKTHDSSFFEVSETSSPLPEKGTPERQTSYKLLNTSREIYEIKNGKIHVGENVWLREEVWKKICSSAKDSLFVKEMAVALWGTATLKNKSVSGKECPTNKNPVKPPLTPSKLQVLRVCFSDWLRTKEPEKKEREKRENRVGYYISQKIQDIIKKEKRNEKV